MILDKRIISMVEHGEIHRMSDEDLASAVEFYEGMADAINLMPDKYYLAALAFYHQVQLLKAEQLARLPGEYLR